MQYERYQEISKQVLNLQTESCNNIIDQELFT